MKLSSLLICITCATGVSSGLPAFAAPAGQPSASAATQHDETTSPADVAADIDFLLQAWRANAQELGAARLALQRSRDVRVRQFARLLVREHSAANLRFQRLATLRGLGIPQAVRASRPASEFGLERLRGLAFDRQFVASVGLQAHREAIERFQEQAKHGRDRALVSFAAAELPMLRKHLARAEALRAQLELQRRNLAPAR